MKIFAAVAGGALMSQAGATFPESLTIGGVAAVLLLFILNRFSRLLDDTRADRLNADERQEKTAEMLAGVIRESTEAKVAMVRSTDRLERTIESLMRTMNPGAGEQWRERP